MTAETAVTTARVRRRGQLTLLAEVPEALRAGHGVNRAASERPPAMPDRSNGATS
jgi:hypothetical protein